MDDYIDFIQENDYTIFKYLCFSYITGIAQLYEMLATTKTNGHYSTHPEIPYSKLYMAKPYGSMKTELLFMIDDPHFQLYGEMYFGNYPDKHAFKLSEDSPVTMIYIPEHSILPKEPDQPSPLLDDDIYYQEMDKWHYNYDAQSVKFKQWFENVRTLGTITMMSI